MRKNSISALLLVCLLAVAAAAQVEKGSERSRTDALKIGETAPDFSLTDENGKTVTLSKLKQPAVLVFYRGYW